VSGRSMKGTRTYGGSGTSHSLTTAYGVAHKHTHLKFFPMKFAFSTMQEINEYVSGHTIQCLECGHEYRNLGRHLFRHNTDVDSYRIKYGIPKGIALVVAEILKINSETAKSVNSQLNDDEKIAKMNRMRKANRTRPDMINVPEAIKILRIEAGKKNKGKRRVLPLVKTKCPECNAEHEVAINVAKRGNFLCAVCREKHYYVSQEKYFKNNIDKIHENQRKNYIRRMFNGDEVTAEAYMLILKLKREIINGK